MIMIRKGIFWMLMGIVVLMMGCTGGQETAVSPPQTTTLTLPALDASELSGEPLKVVATTSMIGDVVTQVGGEAIELTTLMGPGQDPHTFQPGAQALTAVSQADVIFINGWDLEESLVQDLQRISEGVPVVPISANIEPLPADEDAHIHDDEHEDNENEAHAGSADPHVWFSIAHVKQWTENVAQVLSERDPEHAQTYKDNAAAYQSELDALQAYAEEQFAQIPADKRFLVTNHDSLSYLAHDYGFEVIGTVIPAASTLAEPSASDLADLIAEMDEHNICSIFTEATVSDALAQTVAAELDNCTAVQVLPLYTGAIGPTGSGADSLIGMFRANVDTIVEGLR